MADCLIQTKPGPGIPESEFLASGHKKEIFEIDFFGSIAKRIENETNRPNYFWWVTKTPASQAGKMAVMGRKAVRDRPWVKPPHPQQRPNESWNTQWAKKRHHDHGRFVLKEYPTKVLFAKHQQINKRHIVVSKMFACFARNWKIN